MICEVLLLNNLENCSQVMVNSRMFETHFSFTVQYIAPYVPAQCQKFIHWSFNYTADWPFKRRKFNPATFSYSLTPFISHHMLCVSWGWISERNLGHNLKTFAPCYSSPPADLDWRFLQQQLKVSGGLALLALSLCLPLNVALFVIFFHFICI